MIDMSIATPLSTSDNTQQHKILVKNDTVYKVIKFKYLIRYDTKILSLNYSRMGI